MTLSSKQRGYRGSLLHVTVPLDNNDASPQARGATLLVYDGYITNTSDTNVSVE